jgi:D12 class N6 adenine-specific DNA methyltransferase
MVVVLGCACFIWDLTASMSSVKCLHPNKQFVVNSPLAYIGGKTKPSKTIIEMMPAYKACWEMFAGAAWVFFRKPPSKYEVINDLDSDLACF